jgi:acetyltransferase-like isoleucine patch superfamily enzyme
MRKLILKSLQNLYRQLVKMNQMTSLFMRRLKLAKLGENPSISNDVQFEYPDRVKIGNNVTVAEQCIIRANTELTDDWGSIVGVELGDGTSIREFCLLNTNQGRIKIGERSWLGAAGQIYGNGTVTIGDDVLIGAQCVINTVSHEYADLKRPINDQGINTAPVVIGNNVWIGLGCKILQGVTIGEGAIIGANSLVTKDIPAFSIAYGSPATVKSIRSEAKVCAA